MIPVAASTRRMRWLNVSEKYRLPAPSNAMSNGPFSSASAGRPAIAGKALLAGADRGRDDPFRHRRLLPARSYDIGLDRNATQTPRARRKINLRVLRAARPRAACACRFDGAKCRHAVDRIGASDMSDEGSRGWSGSTMSRSRSATSTRRSTWYGRIFDFTLRGKGERNAFIDMGDQFVNLTLVPDQQAEGVERRHIGFVVDDRSSVKARAEGSRRGDGRGAVPRFSRPLGQPASRSSSIRTSSSPRRRTCCAAWAWRSTRTTRRRRNSPTRGWRRNEPDHGKQRARCS